MAVCRYGWRTAAGERDTQAEKLPRQVGDQDDYDCMVVAEARSASSTLKYSFHYDYDLLSDCDLTIGACVQNKRLHQMHRQSAKQLTWHPFKDKRSWRRRESVLWWHAPCTPPLRRLRLNSQEISAVRCRGGNQARSVLVMCVCFNLFQPAQLVHEVVVKPQSWPLNLWKGPSSVAVH